MIVSQLLQMGHQASCVTTNPLSHRYLYKFSLIQRPNGDDADTVPMDVSSNDNNRPTTSTETSMPQGSPMDTSTASPPDGSTDASRAEPAAPPQPEGTTGARTGDAPGANGRAGTV